MFVSPSDRVEVPNTLENLKLLAARREAHGKRLSKFLQFHTVLRSIITERPKHKHVICVIEPSSNVSTPPAPLFTPPSPLPIPPRSRINTSD